MPFEEIALEEARVKLLLELKSPRAFAKDDSSLTFGHAAA